MLYFVTAYHTCLLYVLSLYIHIYIHICIYVYVYIYIYIHICTHHVACHTSIVRLMYGFAIISAT